MSTRKTPARKVRAVIRFMHSQDVHATHNASLLFHHEAGGLTPVAVLPVDDEQALIEQVACTLYATSTGDVKSLMEQKSSLRAGYMEEACVILLSLGILKAKRKTRRDAR